MLLNNNNKDLGTTYNSNFPSIPGKYLVHVTISESFASLVVKDVAHKPRELGLLGDFRKAIQAKVFSTENGEREIEEGVTVLGVQ